MLSLINEAGYVKENNLVIDNKLFPNILRNMFVLFILLTFHQYLGVVL